MFVESPDELINPYAATGPDGEFTMGDWRGFFGVGEAFTVFLSTSRGCQRLLSNGSVVEFPIGNDTDVVELGELTIASLEP